jgi:hypothetical protein
MRSDSDSVGRSVKFHIHIIALLMVGTALLSGCARNHKVKAEFPEMVVEPVDLRVVLVMNHDFRTYTAKPNKKDRIELGEAQTEVLTKAFNGLFSQVKVVYSWQRGGPDADLVITPSVREVQLSSPSESYQTVFEVWIKYSLHISTADGIPIDSWFLPAYGKTPYSYLFSRSKAIEEATIMALRDTGAKLMLDFFRIPAVNGWIQQNLAANEKQ